jgi:uncharacterized protein YdbL (DUF1318 family)
MKFRTLTALAVAGILFSAQAFAMDLHAARNAGLIGEKLDGYVAVLKHTPEADALAAEVNAKRKTEYAKISAANAQPLDVVGTLAAAQIIEKLDKGDKYQSPEGGWKTK